MNEFEINGRKFKLLKLDALTQFHILRRVGPLFSELVPAMSQISKVSVDLMGEEEKFKEFSKIISPLVDGLAKLSDTDANFVLYRLLSAVEVHQPQFGNWSRVAIESGIVMQDLDLPILLQAAGRALMHNLSGFFASLPRK